MRNTFILTLLLLLNIANISANIKKLAHIRMDFGRIM